MMRPITETKLKAKTLLNGRYAVLIAASVFVEIITLLISNLVFTENTSLLFSFAASGAITLLSGILEGGLRRLYLKAADEQQPTVSDLFYYFRSGPDRFILIALILLVLDEVLTIPFGLLLPAEISYWIVPLPFLTAAPTAGIPLVIRIILSILWALIAIAVRIPFLFAYYIAADHEEYTLPRVFRTCIAVSKNDYLRLLLLLISFAGYLILGLFTLGIGYLWIVPYMRMSVTVFYRSHENNAE